MNVKVRSSRAIAGTLAVVGGAAALAIPVATASASAGTVHGGTLPLPVGALLFPFAPPTLPSNCPFDLNGVFVLTGNGVSYGTGNKNGDWGGGTATGAAVLMEADTVIYTGHATAWFGGGNNARGQQEIAETFTFNGTSATDGSSLSFHINWQATQNANGTITAVTNNVSCS
jgi:hypothetical protein